MEIIIVEDNSWDETRRIAKKLSSLFGNIVTYLQLRI